MEAFQRLQKKTIFFLDLKLVQIMYDTNFRIGSSYSTGYGLLEKKCSKTELRVLPL